VRQVAVGASLMNTFKGKQPSSDVFDMDSSGAIAWPWPWLRRILPRRRAPPSRKTLSPRESSTTSAASSSARPCPPSFSALSRTRAGSRFPSRGGTGGHRVLPRRNRQGARRALEVPTASRGGRALPPRLLVNSANDGLAGVVAQADRLAHHFGLYCGYDLPDGELQPLPSDLAEVEAACGGIERVLERAFSFIEGASGTPERWYAAA